MATKNKKVRDNIKLIKRELDRARKSLSKKFTPRHIAASEETLLRLKAYNTATMNLMVSLKRDAAKHIEIIDNTGPNNGY